MRVILQRVLDANLKVDNIEQCKIGKGYFLLVGITAGDNEVIVTKMVEKILKLRIFEDENGKTNLSISDVDGEILAMSQFTLCASVKDGNRPSFISAGDPKEAKRLYEYACGLIKERYPKSQFGTFASDAKINLTNDGPFTLYLDSDEIIKK